MVPDGDRALIEDAVKLLLSAAPAGWTQMHAEFEPVAQLATAWVGAEAGPQPLAVSAGAISAVAECQRRAAAAGAPWQRLVIDCYTDGRLAVHTEGAPGPSAAAVPQPRRWPRRVLMAITAGCLCAAAVLFALGRPWSTPPRADIIPVPTPSPRQQQATEVILAWYDAQNRGDVAAMRAVTCREPGANITDTIAAVEAYGVDERIYIPDGVSAFDDQGSTLRVEFASHIKALNAYMRSKVDAARAGGGFFFDTFTLIDDGNGGLKICDDELLPR